MIPGSEGSELWGRLYVCTVHTDWLSPPDVAIWLSQLGHHQIHPDTQKKASAQPTMSHSFLGTLAGAPLTLSKYLGKVFIGRVHLTGGLAHQYCDSTPELNTRCRQMLCYPTEQGIIIILMSQKAMDILEYTSFGKTSHEAKARTTSASNFSNIQFLSTRYLVRISVSGTFQYLV